MISASSSNYRPTDLELLHVDPNGALVLVVPLPELQL